MGQPWFPLVYFGGLTVLSAGLLAVAPGLLLPFWLGGSAAGLVLIGRHYRRRVQTTGVGARAGSWWIGIGMSLACLAVAVVAGHVAGASAGVLAPVGVVVLGYLALSAIQGSCWPALGVLACAVLSVGVAALSAPAWSIELVFGLSLTTLGGLLRRRSGCRLPS